MASTEFRSAARGLLSGCLISLAVVCGNAARGDAVAPPEAFELDIERQPLGGALQKLARQSGLQIIFFSSMTQGLAAPALEGRHTLAEALDHLLRGSGLTYRVINSRTVEVRQQRSRAAAAELAAAPSQEVGNVPGDAMPPREGGEVYQAEVVVVGVAEQLVATRSATPLREIPQTISIVTRDQIKQQYSANLLDVLKRAPGITVGRSSSLDVDFYARGYDISSFHIDGGAAMNPKIQGSVLFLGTPDLSEFDHVEILRGSDGLFGADATPGGTVSLVRKRAQRNFAATIEATAGSWDSSRVELDVTGPLAQDGRLRGRADVLYARENSFYRPGPHERQKIFATLEYDVTPRGTLTVGGSHQWDDASLTASAIPFHSDGRDARVPRDTSLSFDWNRYRSRLSEIYLQYRHELGDNWDLKVNTAGWRAKVEYAHAYFLGPIGLPADGIEAPHGAFTASPNIHEQATADVTLTAALDWFGGRQEIAIGADFIRIVADPDKYDIFGFGEPLDDLLDFDPRAYPDPRATNSPDQVVSGWRSTKQYGLFTTFRAHLGDRLSATAGARISGDKERWSILTQWPPYGEYLADGTERVKHVVTPYAGVMYDLSPHYSIYASYADIYDRTGMHRRPSGKLLGPIHGVNIEAGLKGAWRDGALNGSLAIYEVEQRNIPAAAPRETDEWPDCCSRGVSSKSRGVDIDLQGEAVPGWTLGAGYSYNVNRNPEGEILSSITPKHLVKAWTNLRLPGAAHRWQLGANLLAQGKSFTRLSMFTPEGLINVEGVQRSYAVLDLRAAYELTPSWQVTLGLNNIFDKIYYEAVGSPNMHGWYGEPRNWMLKVDGRY
jgi:outer membrane receptor for ferric coprogen and ferric-rhodotorulic acid